MRDKPSALPFRLWKFLQEELKMSHFSQFGSSISLILSSTSASTNIFLQRRLVCNVLCVSFTTTDHQIWDNGFVKRKPVILHQSPFTVTPIFSLGSVIMHGNNYLILLYVFLMSLHEDWSILIKFHKLSELSDLHGLCVNLESINQLFVNGKCSTANKLDFFSLALLTSFVNGVNDHLIRFLLLRQKFLTFLTKLN